MKHLYGSFHDTQIHKYKHVLHNSVHWLLIYKEEDQPQLDRYFESLLYRISGLNDILFHPPELVALLSLLQTARNEAAKEDCDFRKYRKMILDSHSLIDKIKEADE